MGELQLEIICDRLKREFDVDASLGKPQIVYKETLTCAADGEMKYANQTGDCGLYAHVKLHLFPAERGTGYVFENKIEGGSIPAKYIKPIDDGVREALTLGILAGCPVVDVRVELYGGSFHEVDSSEVTFKIAGSLAFQDAARRAKPVLLEPIMLVEVIGPRDEMGDVAANLAMRCGKILSQEGRGGTQIIRARVPLSGMFGYASDLRSRSQGRANYTLQLDCYEPVRVGPEGDDDRISYIGWPVTPRRPLNRSAAALPEPD